MRTFTKVNYKDVKLLFSRTRNFSLWVPAPFSETRTYLAVKQHVNQVSMRLNGQQLFY